MTFSKLFQFDNMIIISTSIQHLLRVRCYVRWYSEVLIWLLFDLEEIEN